MLQGFSADDWLVPYQQAAGLADAMHAADPAAHVDSLQLELGTIPFGHGGVTAAAGRVLRAGDTAREPGRPD